MVHLIIMFLVVLALFAYYIAESRNVENRLKAINLSSEIYLLKKQLTEREKRRFLEQVDAATRICVVYSGRKVNIHCQNGQIYTGVIVGKKIEREGIYAFPFGMVVIVLNTGSFKVKIPVLMILEIDAIGYQKVSSTEDIIYSARVLGIDPSFTELELKAAYRKLCKIYHPDLHEQSSEEAKVENENKFKEISKAYAVCKKRFC